jgi:uncharacterized membrane protein YhaH (DUF805 family)
MKLYMQVLRKYAVFQGRAGRKEFWMFALWDNCLQLLYFAIGFATELNKELFYFLILLVYGALTACPRLALIWRRYHDMNRSGLNFFWVVVPLVGPFIVLITMAASGTRGENNYGPDPLESQAGNPPQSDRTIKG